MNMKCAICGSDKFHLDIENQTVSCTACSFYCDFKALVRGSAAPQAQAQPQRPAYNPADFEIVGGVLKKYKGAAVDVVVPDGVIEIGAEAFYCLKHLQNVRLPHGVKIIGNKSFFGCDNLIAVVLPNTLEEIGCESFGHCKKLKSISLPNGLRIIRESAFSGSLSLENIVIPDGVRDIGKYAFLSSGLKSIVIPDSVSKIGEAAFYGCKELSKVVCKIERFPIAIFDGSPFFRSHPEGQRLLLLRKKCPACMGELNMLKRCKNCGKSW